MSIDKYDLIAAGGAGLLACGIGMFSIPIMLIVVGMGMIALGVFGAMGERMREAKKK